MARVGLGLWRHDVSSAASSMAFNFFLSLIPLLVLVGYVLGHFVRKNGVDAVMSPFLDTVPLSAAEIIRQELERLADSGDSTVAPLSIAGFLWLTSSGTHHMMDVFEGVAKAPPRPWWKQRAIAAAVVVVGLGAVCATAWVVLDADERIHAHDATTAGANGGDRAGDSAGFSKGGTSEPHLFAAASSADASARAPVTPLTATPASPPREPAASAWSERRRTIGARVHASWENWVAVTLMLAVSLGSLSAFYRYAVEHPTGVRRRAWPGAWVALGAWLVCSWGFGNYVISLGKYAMYYGSLAAVAVLLIWLWLTSLSLLLGAEVNAQLEAGSR